MSDKQIIDSCKNAILSLDKNSDNYRELFDLMLDSLSESCNSEDFETLVKDLESEGLL